MDTGVAEFDEIELYSYGFNLLLKKIAHASIILSIGMMTGEFWNVLVFLLTYIAMREYSGGYHAKTEAGCYTCTIIVMISVIIMIKRLPGLNSIVSWILLLFSAVIIWFLSPQDAENKPLDVEERYIYRKKARKLLIISAIIILSGYANTAIFLGSACAWIIQAIMLLMAMSRKLVIG